MTVKGVECGGWAFERANTLYPDVDDTAVAMSVLVQIRKVVPSLRQRIETALRRAEIWVRAMQSSNGGWGAFDKDNNRWLLPAFPSAISARSWTRRARTLRATSSRRSACWATA